MDMWQYEEEAGAWTELPPSPIPLSSSAAHAVVHGTAHFISGSDHVTYSAEKGWQRLRGLSYTLDHATAMDIGRYLVYMGGYGSDTTVSYYDSVTRSTRTVGDLTTENCLEYSRVCKVSPTLALVLAGGAEKGAMILSFTRHQHKERGCGRGGRRMCRGRR
ncbi:hypothetical protein KIPB_011032 [Kipferlia bialata]|uniref:Kelch-type beta propeller n=1 Tax=Kipferlia bialata TaxID=797122 RepID=A0A9K3D5Y6_9EUKA|nr:hypothetical protein KIPB_011032 [Kipferlia bialata]|eukprot:g11032.t1